MARPRRPVQTLQDVLATPAVAAPTGGAQTTAGQLSLPVLDFAPISKTIQGYLQDKAQEEGVNKAQEGERWVLEHPELTRHMESQAADIKDPAQRDAYLRDQFAFLQRNGIIPPMGDPYQQIGYARAAGRLMAATYRDNLQGRLNELSNTRDPATGQVLAAPDVDRILGEEWAKVGNAPAVQNPYGAAEALGLKAQADAEFRSRASLRRAQAQEKDYRDLLQNEIGGKFEQLLSEHPTVDSRTLAPVTDFIASEVRGHNVLDARDLTVAALAVTLDKISAVDPTEAVRAAHAAQDLVVGDVRLGDDRSAAGAALQAAVDRTQERARESAVRAVQQGEAERRLQIQKGEAEYVPLLLRAQHDNQSVQDVARRLGDQFLADDQQSGKFAGNGAFVVDAMNDYARSLDANRVSDKTVVDRIQTLMADGDFDTADALSRASLGSGSLTGGAYAQIQDSLRQRADVGQYVERSDLFNSVRVQYQEMKPTGYVPEVQQQINDRVLDLQRSLVRDFSAYVRTTAGQPNRDELHRTWLDQRQTQDAEIIRKIEAEKRGPHDQLIANVRQRLERYQDAGGAIAEGEKDGRLTVLEAQKLREDNTAAGDGRDQFLKTQDFAEAERSLERQTSALTGGSPGPEDLAVLDEARAALRDKVLSGMDGVLADPKVDPRSFSARSRDVIRQARQEIEDRFYPSPEAKSARAALQAGATGEEAAQVAHEAGRDLARSRAWSAAVADPAQRARLTAGMFDDQAKNVPPQFYKYAAAWMSGVDPVFGDPVERADVESRAVDALRRAQDPAAVASVLSIVGVSPQDVLRGSLDYGPPADQETRINREIAGHEAMLRAGSIFPGYIQSTIDALRAQLAPVHVSLEGAVLKPYTTPFFRSEQTMRAFREDPAYPDFLRRIGIDPDDRDALAEWETQQIKAIARTNP